MAFPGGSNCKESACDVGDPGSTPGSGRSPGEGNGHPLQYSCLENPTDRGAWWAARTRRRDRQRMLRGGHRLSRDSNTFWKKTVNRGKTEEGEGRGGGGEGEGGREHPVLAPPPCCWVGAQGTTTPPATPRPNPTTSFSDVQSRVKNSK